jgi:hypothetical protein
MDLIHELTCAWSVFRKVESLRSFGGMWEREGRVLVVRASKTTRCIVGWIRRVCFGDFDVVSEVEEEEFEFCAFLFGHWDA